MTNDMTARIDLAPDLNISRLVTGLWQVADMERSGVDLNNDHASDALIEYVNDGFDTFDMADHYGSAELIAGEARRKLIAHSATSPHRLALFTKWCPQPAEHSYEAVYAGICERVERLGVDCIDLLQLHWWSFDHPGYIDVMDSLMRLKQNGLIRHIGVTNFDTDHLHLLVNNGYEILTNQICVSLLDRRALGDMSQLCAHTGIRLLAYGTLAGGFLNEKWLGAPQPDAIADWSRMKYQRFISASGGWDAFQHLLSTLAQIAQTHQVSIANVAARWVLQQDAVGAVIVGARLTESEHRDSNQRLFEFALSASDLAAIASATDQMTDIPGDSGSEYRRPPFLTASGDLSHHLNTLPKVYNKTPVPGKANRWRISSGSEFEPICGYSRAVRYGNRVMVSGTTATHGLDRAISTGDIRGQAVYILDKISASLDALGATLNDVIRTRVYMKDCNQWEAVSRVHGRYFADCLPANTLLEVSDLVGPYELEIEAEAVVD